jgi:hypothetical protein
MLQTKRRNSLNYQGGNNMEDNKFKELLALKDYIYGDKKTDDLKDVAIITLQGDEVITYRLAIAVCPEESRAKFIKAMFLRGIMDATKKIAGSMLEDMQKNREETK